MSMRKKMAGRSLLIGGGFTLLFFLIGLRLFWIQSVNADWLNASALSQWEKEEFIDPKRGAILDRNGQKLAYNGPSYNVVAVLSKNAPSSIQDPVDAAKKLSPILNMSAEKLIQLMSRSDKYQVELRPGGWKISEEQAAEIQALKIPGIILQKNTNRYYPNNAFAAHTIGYVDKEGEAKMGLELYYDEILRGEPGKYRFIKDAKNRVLPKGIEDYQPAKDGNDLVLTIDQRIQHFVEQALDDSANSFQAKGLMAIVADPNTMEILAMASRPHFDPNQYSTSPISNYKNLAIQTTYEPGSTFKILTLAAAIEEGVFQADEVYQSGQYSSKSIQPPIKDWTNPNGWGQITFKEGIQRSSNVGAVILGYERVGKDKLYEYYDKFGLGKKTGIDFPYEAVGKLPNPKTAPPRDIAVTTFGQGMTVTGIEQITAVSAAINGGKLMKPYLVKEIRDSHTGKIIKQNQPTVLGNPISAETSKEVREVLESVVSSPNGTGRGYAIDGYRIGGKTGTAQKVEPNGKYSKDKFIYSFVGFAPADRPRLIVYIVVDEPNVNVQSSSAVVGKIFKDVMRNSLQYLQVEPDEDESETVVQKESEPISEMLVTPNFVQEYSKVAKSDAASLGLIPVVIGSGEKVLRQFPEADSSLESGSRIYLLTEEEPKLPDFKGKSLREVLEFCSLVGIEVNTSGSGYVVEQSIPPDTPVNKGQQLYVTLEPLNPQSKEEINESLPNEDEITTPHSGDQSEPSAEVGGEGTDKEAQNPLEDQSERDYTKAGSTD